jgi:hypothetical protein
MELSWVEACDTIESDGTQRWLGNDVRPYEESPTVRTLL